MVMMQDNPIENFYGKPEFVFTGHVVTVRGLFRLYSTGVCSLYGTIMLVEWSVV